MATLPGMRDRTIIINSMSKTYSVTGWRIGWVMAQADLRTEFGKFTTFLLWGLQRHCSKRAQQR